MIGPNYIYKKLFVENVKTNGEICKKKKQLSNYFYFVNLRR